jgi:hypothetical protein
MSFRRRYASRRSLLGVPFRERSTKFEMATSATRSGHAFGEQGSARFGHWLPRPWLPPSRSHPTRVILKQEATRRSLRRGRLNFLARAEYGTTSPDRVGDRAPRRSLSGSLRRACSDQPDATDPRRSNPSSSRGQRISFYAVRQGSLNPIIVIFVARFFSSSGPETSYLCRVSERTLTNQGPALQGGCNDPVRDIRF